MATKSKSKQDEVNQLLDDLDSFEMPPPGSAPIVAGTQAPAAGEAEVFAFIDEITQKSTEPPRSSSHLERPLSRAGTPSLRKSTERVKVGGGAVPLLPNSSSSGSPALSRTESSSSRTTVAPPKDVNQNANPGGWGWGSVWSSASAAIQQAKSVVDEQVKNLPKNEQARKWGEGVLEYAKTAQLDKLSKFRVTHSINKYVSHKRFLGQDFKRVGLSTLTDLLNVVAPPISEHEVIQVWLSHDMRGYDGVESLVYRALARILEQVEGGDLVVNRGDESKPKETSSDKRDLGAVDGYEAALKLAQANLDELIKRNIQPPPATSSAQNPTTYSYVYIRIQPFITSVALPESSTSPEGSAASHPSLQFILYLSDPSHQLIHSTITQSIPGKWLDLWDQYDWVEDLVVEAIRLGVEVLGQEYVVSRMGWDKKQEPEEKAEEPTVSVTEAA
ncbi:unnamed protein product [Somion occarium]|uniref:Maintenance of telomere capping protein 1 n=1 Tax=Somion occarium TaxID=3059160 RepID=A0ABP1CL85_9APHY